MAEALLRARIKSQKFPHDVKAASVGTHNYHIGEAPDYRTVRICQENGIDASNIKAAQISMQDFETYDLILGMDKSHVIFLKDKCPEQYKEKIHLFMEYAGFGKLEVPDPYYGEMEDFLQVYEMVSKGTGAILGIVLQSYVIGQEDVKGELV
jgi:protein-tyrosine phosphatase